MIVNLDFEEHKKYLSEIAWPAYRKEQYEKLRLLSTTIIPLRPDVGYFIQVNGKTGIEISESCFSEEYKSIVTAMNSVINKLETEFRKTDKK